MASLIKILSGKFSELAQVVRRQYLSGDFYASYDKVGMIVVIAVMAVTAIGCFVRDRLELV